MPRSHLIFDIETVPDLFDLAKAHGIDPWDDEALKALIGDGLPPLPFCEVVVIAYMRIALFTADPQDCQCKALYSGERDEAAIIEKFFHDVDGMGAILVSFNGMGFDFPVARYRALKHAATAGTFAHPKLYHRYNGEHLDLCDILASHDGRARTSLGKICSLLGVNGKTDGVDGSRLDKMIAAGRIKDVAAYCMDDVAATARVFLRNELLEGSLDLKRYNASVALVNAAADVEKPRVLAPRWRFLRAAIRQTAPSSAPYVGGAVAFTPLLFDFESNTMSHSPRSKQSFDVAPHDPAEIEARLRALGDSDDFGASIIADGAASDLVRRQRSPLDEARGPCRSALVRDSVMSPQQAKLLVDAPNLSVAASVLSPSASLPHDPSADDHSPDGAGLRAWHRRDGLRKTSRDRSRDYIRQVVIRTVRQHRTASWTLHRLARRANRCSDPSPARRKDCVPVGRHR